MSGEEVTQEVISDLFKILDIDGDGKISFEEFKK